MKKNIFAFVILTLICVKSYSFTDTDIQAYTLENGLKVYLLPDTESAAVRLELNIYAGFSAQQIHTTGYLKLYAALLDLTITDNYVYTVKQFAPLDIEEQIQSLTSYFEPLNIDDKTLKTKYDKEQKSQKEFADSAAGFINAAIDTKLYPSSPWKTSSAYNEQNINVKNMAQVRNVLKDIQKSLYTPANAAVFISGNIDTDKTLSLLTSYLNPFSSQVKYKTAELTSDYKSSGNYFVLVDDQFSSDMTQVAILYTNIQDELCDFASKVLNNPMFTLKTNLAMTQKLGIRAADYIDVSSQHKKTGSNLVIQTILEKTKATPPDQVMTLIDLIQSNEITNDEESALTLSILDEEYKTIQSSSYTLMEDLSSYISTSRATDSIFSYFNRIQSYSSIKSQEINSITRQNTPYVFALVNTQNYNKYAKSFTDAGFITLKGKSALWYTMSEYKKLFAPEKKQNEQDIKDLTKKFIESNKGEFYDFTLNNSIPVTVKHNKNDNTATISFIIKGGELLFMNEKSGLTMILTDAIAANIQNQLKGKAQVTSETLSSYSSITITTSKQNLYEAAKIAGWTLIYSDITPATADEVAYDRRSQWRIKSGSAEFQLLSEAVKLLYKDGDYKTLFNVKEDKPSQMDFTNILSAYPLLLDSSRYKVIVSGNINDREELKKALNVSFGLLDTIKNTQSKDKTVPKPVFKNTIKKISIKHTFLTDIPKEKAGPRPVVLIPTKNFNDPALYCFACPDIKSTDYAIFNSLILELCKRIQTKLEGEQKIRFDKADDKLPFARLYFTKLDSIQKTDDIFRQSVHELIEQLKKDGSKDTQRSDLIKTMESQWIMAELSQSATSYGQSNLIKQGVLFNNSTLYLDQYNEVHNAKASDYYIIASVYLDSAPVVKLYSKDTKR